MDIKLILENWIKKTLGVEGDLPASKAGLVLVHPKEIKNGDFTVILNPDDAEESFKKLEADRIPEVEKMELLSGRFINIYLSKEFFGDSIEEILNKKEKFGENNKLGGEKTIIEYTNTNVLKPLHIGHLMGNVIGESLSRLLEWNGALIKRDTYQGDSGLHIAKAIWGVLKLGGRKKFGSSSDAALYIGEAYALGANSYEDDPTVATEIKEINKKLFEKSDKDLIEIYEWARQISLDHFEELYKKLGTKFDYYFFESEITQDALKIVKEFLAHGLFEESDGAIIFRGEKYDKKLHTRVFVNSQGIPMYEAKDIAHALRKYKTYQSQKSIIVTANEQDEYFKVVLCALSHINKEITDQTMHLSHGLLKLADGKMSSRKGNVITGESLITDVEELIKDKIKDRGFSEEEKGEIAEIVAIGAIKYSILRQAVGGDIIFDFEKSISFEGDSGPYLQYTAVRAKSVLEKAKSENLSDIQAGINIENKIPENWETTELERLMYRFPEIVERAASEYSPHYLVTYLTEIAGAFNAFYAQNKIIDAENPALSSYRLALTEAVAIILSNGLNLLGIKVPEKM